MTFDLKWIMPLHAVGPEENPKARLIGRVQILGADFHVNAEQVTTDPNTEIQSTVIEEGDTHAPEIWAFTDTQPAETVKINGRDYLLAITPFQEYKIPDLK